jgi:hypothetical protein
VDAARDELATAGCSVAVVAQATPEVLARYVAKSQWHVPLLSDPNRAAYAAFGLERTGRFSFFRPKVLWGYFRGMLRGYGVKAPYEGEDILQLGGDFVLDKLRRIVFAYPSAAPTDRPSVSAIRAAIPSVAENSQR